MLQILKSPATATNMKFEYFRSIQAHESPIACLAMSHDGSLIATTSVKGILIRIFDLRGQLLKEVRRSRVHPANVISMVFSECQNYLCCSFDSQTVHIFYLKDIKRNGAVPDYNKSSYYKRFVKSPLSKAGKYLTGYHIDTVLCKKADLTFKCQSKCPVILSVEVNEYLGTIKLIINEGFYMPSYAYECNLTAIENSRKIGFKIKKEFS